MNGSLYEKPVRQTNFLMNRPLMNRHFMDCPFDELSID